MPPISAIDRPTLAIARPPSQRSKEATVAILLMAILLLAIIGASLVLPLDPGAVQPALFESPVP